MLLILVRAVGSPQINTNAVATAKETDNRGFTATVQNSTLIQTGRFVGELTFYETWVRAVAVKPMQDRLNC